MSNFIQLFLNNFNSSIFWNSLLISVPFIISIFMLSFSYYKIKEWLSTRKINSFMSVGGKHISRKDYDNLYWEEI